MRGLLRFIAKPSILSTREASVPASSSLQAIARGLFCALLLMGPSGRASGEVVTFGDLVGLNVEADIQRRQDMRRQGHPFSSEVHQSWKIDINGDKTIDVTVNTTFRGSQGIRKAPPSAGRFTLDETRAIESRGGGQGAWSFTDGALHFTRTFQSGAYRAHFEFARGETGLTCTVTEAFAREGTKDITAASPFGGQVTIINSEPISSVCQAKPAKPK
jgi:hypothetical protein